MATKTSKVLGIWDPNETEHLQSFSLVLGGDRDTIKPCMDNFLASPINLSNL